MTQIQMGITNSMELFRPLVTVLEIAKCKLQINVNINININMYVNTNINIKS